MSFFASPLDQRAKSKLFIGTIGYESRASWALASGYASGQRKIGFTFPYGHAGAFQRNLAAFREAGAEISNAQDDSEFSRVLGDALDSEIEAHGSLEASIDVSSMTRARIATTVLEVRTRLEVSPGSVHFLYSMGEYIAPPESTASLSAEPLLPEFRGNLRRASIPLGAILGLGYESKRAVGAYELIEPARAWVFVPDGDDPKFDAALQQSNSGVLTLLTPDTQLHYPVRDPFATYAQLESLVFVTKHRFRLVMVPMGPKPFALSCMLLGASRDVDRPAVWRVGVRGQHSAIDVRPSGPVVGMTVGWKSSSASTQAGEGAQA